MDECGVYPHGRPPVAKPVLGHVLQGHNSYLPTYLLSVFTPDAQLKVQYCLD